MKTLKSSFFWAIFIALVAAFSACDLNPNIVDPDPEPEPVVKDSVVIEATIKAPVGTIFHDITLTIRHSALPKGYTYQTYMSTVLNFRFVFYDEVARAMVGTQCEVVPNLCGQVNGEAYAFFKVNPVVTNVIIQKVTKVTIDVE